LTLIYGYLACASHGFSPSEFTLADAGLVSSSGQEIVLRATVAQKKAGSSDYIMPEVIDVSVFSG